MERILERAEGLARIIREGVGSAWFEVCVESGPPLTRAKGKDREREERGREPWRRMYDPAEMDNVYSGYGEEKSRVLCTVEFGLAVVKKRNPNSTLSLSGGKDGAVEEERRRSRRDEWMEEKRKELLETTMLLKPKVLLESVKELL